MTIHALIPLVSFFAYCVLLGLTLCFGRSRARRQFAFFLLPAMVWSLSSFILRVRLLPEYAEVWGRVLCVSIIATAVAYYHFAQAFQNRRAGTSVYLGYAGLGLFAIFAILGYFPRSVALSNARDGMVYLDRGPLLYPAAVLSVGYIVMAIVSLLRRYSTLTSPLERTRTAYLMMGIAILTLLSLSNLSDTLSAYSIDHIGNVISSCLIGYAIMRHRLLDISVVIRRGLAYSVATLLMTALYFSSFFLLQKLFQDWQVLSQSVAIGATAILAAAFHMPATTGIQRFVDRLFLGKSYDYRQRLARFSSDMGHVLDLEELAHSMLQLTTKAVGATQASLMLPHRGGFIVQFACQSKEGEPLAFTKLEKGNPIVAWIEREGKPLPRDVIETAYEFKALWETETREIDAVGCELLCPLMSNGAVVGILALGKKERGDPYTSEDLDLLMSVAGDVAVMVENARQHAAIKVEVNTDELTSLFNHRCFHDLLEVEIHRSSRFGLNFSLVMLDLDFFKTYNDVYGHFAGDALLRKVAECVTIAKRRTDLAFRYGGEEFAIILPEATADEAYRVAERVRKTIEAQMAGFGVMLTISAGVASWPKDAVMSSELVQSADAALYHAKQMGRNCTRLASQLPVGAIDQLHQGYGQAGTLSLVYALAATVDAKDHYTYGHSRKVSKYAALIGDALGLGEARIAVLRNSGLLHDIGKIGVSDAVLRKPASLDREEWKQLKAHPELGAAIIRHVDQLASCLPAILYHHEHSNGFGYPYGLQGENIPLEARILSVADAYDAMTSARPYRGPMTMQQALDELMLNAGTQFDPKIVETFASLGSLSLGGELEVPQPRVPLEESIGALRRVAPQLAD